MTTTNETFTSEHAIIHTAPVEIIRPAQIARTHFSRLGGLYAWILVTLAIFLIAGMLSGIQRGQTAADPEPQHVDSVSAVHVRAP